MPGRKAPQAQRREEILAAAREVSLQEGLEGLTVRKVAVAAGLSPGLVFFHFATKDALLVALLEQLQGWLLRVVDVSDQPTPAARLLALLRGETLAARQDAGELTLLLQYWVLAARRPDLRPALLAALQRYREVFDRAAREVAASVSLDPERVSAMATSLVLGGALQGLVDPGFDPDTSLDALAALLQVRDLSWADAGDTG